MEKFQHLELDEHWLVVQQEQRGKRPKFWVSGNGEQWLRKEPNPARPFEPTIEMSTLRLARAIGLEAPESYVCSWREEGNPGRQAKYGIIVKNFLMPDEELAMGADLVNGYHPGYQRNQHGQHTLTLIRSTLDGLEQERRVALREPFVRMLLFDAWIGNSDRHQENWGLIASGGKAARLAPIFDTAACLGAELQDGSLPRVTVGLPKYIEKCGSGFGDGERLVRQGEVLRQLATWPEWAVARDLVAIFRRQYETEVATYFHSIPDAWLPAERRGLAVLLLGERLNWLEEKVR